MDWISHSLWGLTVVRRRKIWWLTIIFGVLPDILYWGYLLFTRAEKIEVYYFTHSLVAAFLIFAFLYFFCRRCLILVVLYLLHIFLDAIVHCGRFGTRFLYPFSDLHFCGFRVSQDPARNSLVIFSINFLILVSVNLLIWKIKLRVWFMKLKGGRRLPKSCRNRI